MSKEVMKVFEYTGKEVRTVIIDNEPWFVAKDVCDILELKNSRKAVGDLDEDERASVTISDTSLSTRETITVQAINEPGLYSLVLKSRKPEAKLFKRWITHEVIPSIRKHGAYMTPETIEKVLLNPDTIINLATALKREQEARVEAERVNNLLMHTKKVYTSTEIAKELGYASPQSLHRDLARREIIYRVNGTWVLYAKYADLGYMETKQQVSPSGHVFYASFWTQEGRKFLLEMLAKTA